MRDAEAALYAEAALTPEAALPKGRRGMRRDRLRPGSERSGVTAVALLMIAAIAACGGEREDATRVPIGEPAERRAWPEGVAAQVDSGNAAFRTGAYEAARRHYAEATRAGPDVSAAWFGLYMAEDALGNAAAADSALARAGELAPAARAHHFLPADSGGRSPDSAGHPSPDSAGPSADTGGT